MVREWDDMVVVGRVARAHGNRGQVIVDPETDFPGERFRVGRALSLNRGGAVEPRRITAARFHQGRPILGLEGVETMAQAEALAGAELRVPASDLSTLPSGMFYRHDLVGCVVTTRSGETVGTVTGVEGTAGACRLIVQAGGAEVLVPLAADICVRIAPADRQIVIDPPEGLLDLNAPGARSRP